MSEAVQQHLPFRYLSHPVEVPEQKIRNYLLNINHSVGGPKAKFFLGKGFSDAEWKVFANAIKLHPIDNPIQDEEPTDYGLKVKIVCKLKTPDASDPCILTVWMVEGTQVPRLVTAYPSKGPHT
jgi:hypothetical protein